jgi:large subunit ribosomal protein L24
MKIKKGDNIVILVGKEKGKKGLVRVAMPKAGQLILEKLNMRKKAVKRTEAHAGGIIDFEAAINVSKIALLCPLCGKATRVGYSVGKDGKKARACKKCQGTFK